MFSYKRGERTGMKDEVQVINCAIEQGLPGGGKQHGDLTMKSKCIREKLQQ